MSRDLDALAQGLFAQFEKLQDEDLTDFELAEEVNRSMSMVHISREVTNIAKLKLSAATTFSVLGDAEPPTLIGLK